APGTAFVLAVFGFRPGQVLSVTLTKPDGTTERSTLTTRTAPGFVTGPNGRIYVPRGGGVSLFQSALSDPLGVYTVLVQDLNGAGARTAVRLGCPAQCRRFGLKIGPGRSCSGSLHWFSASRPSARRSSARRPRPRPRVSAPTLPSAIPTPQAR